MTYDNWKATNRDDEMGLEPNPTDLWLEDRELDERDDRGMDLEADYVRGHGILLNLECAECAEESGDE